MKAPSRERLLKHCSTPMGFWAVTGCMIGQMSSACGKVPALLQIAAASNWYCLCGNDRGCLSCIISDNSAVAGTNFCLHALLRAGISLHILVPHGSVSNCACTGYMGLPDGASRVSWYSGWCAGFTTARSCRACNAAIVMQGLHGKRICVSLSSSPLASGTGHQRYVS